MSQQLQISLTVDETNKVLQSLGKQPFDDVAGIIFSIQRQAQAQLQPQPQPQLQPKRPSEPENVEEQHVSSDPVDEQSA